MDSKLFISIKSQNLLVRLFANRICVIDLSKLTPQTRIDRWMDTSNYGP